MDIMNFYLVHNYMYQTLNHSICELLFVTLKFMINDPLFHKIRFSQVPNEMDKQILSQY